MRYLSGVLLLAAACTAPAAAQERLACQTLADRYEQLSSGAIPIPDLFETPFQFSNLKPDEARRGKMMQADLQIKNHYGAMHCLPSGDLEIVSACMIAPERSNDRFLDARFSAVSTALYAAAANIGIEESTTIVVSLIGEASQSLRGELVKGSENPQGRSSVRLDAHTVAKIETIPAVGSSSLSEICFQIASDLAD